MDERKEGGKSRGAVTFSMESNSSLRRALVCRKQIATTYGHQAGVGGGRTVGKGDLSGEPTTWQSRPDAGLALPSTRFLKICPGLLLLQPQIPSGQGQSHYPSKRGVWEDANGSGTERSIKKLWRVWKEGRGWVWDCCWCSGLPPFYSSLGNLVECGVSGGSPEAHNCSESGPQL